MTEKNENPVSVLAGTKRERIPGKLKLAVSKEEYEKLVEQFPEAKIRKRRYAYFDSAADPEAARLFAVSLRLRTRKKKDGTYLLELRGRGAKLVQARNTISREEYTELCRGVVPDGTVREELRALGLDGPVVKVGTSDTIRRRIAQGNDTLILDESTTDGVSTYEVEFHSGTSLSASDVERLKEKFDIASALPRRTKLDRFWSTKRGS